jgi:DNA ligase-1
MTFLQAAKYFSEIEQISSRLKMTEILKAMFEKISAEEIGPLVLLLQGRVAPLFVAAEFGIADKLVIKALAKSLSLEPQVIEKLYQQLGDLGSTAERLWQDYQKQPDGPVTIMEVFSALETLTRLNGNGSQEEKINSLSDLLTRLDSLSVRYVVRIPLGKLRLGFSDMTMLDALSFLLTGDKRVSARLEEAYNVLPNIAYIAQTVKKSGIEGLKSLQVTIGTPVIPCLCQRLPTAQEMVEKMGEVSVEPKFDGVRVQIHLNKGKITTYSRNLEVTTAMFPELEEIAPSIDAESVILDAEAVGVNPKTGDLLPFQETTTRKRKHGIGDARSQVPLKFFIFDVLFYNGKSLLDRGLSERRKLLETIIQPHSFLAVTEHIVTHDPTEIRRYHETQRKKGLEGIVVKKWSSAYEPGRKGFTWVKLKEEEGSKGKLADTIDAVVMGYYRGEGKRTDFGIGAFLVGIIDKDAIVTLCKIGTGVSDSQWKELKRQFESEKSLQVPPEYLVVDKNLIPDVWVYPKIIVEIAGDDVTVSKNHSAGYAVRFPRLVRIRDDKSLASLTTKDEIITLYQQQ